MPYGFSRSIQLFSTLQIISIKTFENYLFSVKSVLFVKYLLYLFLDLTELKLIILFVCMCNEKLISFHFGYFNY